MYLSGGDNGGEVSEKKNFENFSMSQLCVSIE